MVIPTPDYVRFATHYEFRPDFCHAHDPESNGIVSTSSASRSVTSRSPTPPVTVRLILSSGTVSPRVVRRSERWCARRDLCGPARAVGDRAAVVASVAVAAAAHRSRRGPHRRQAVHDPCCLGPRLGALPVAWPASRGATFDGRMSIYDFDGRLVAEHPQLGPGKASILDEHYPTPRRARSRGTRARSNIERTFLALGEPAEAFIRGGAAA